MENIISVEDFISPTTGTPRVIDIKAAVLTQNKLWRGDAFNTPEEISASDIFSSFALNEWTTETRPISPDGNIIGLNIEYR